MTVRCISRGAYSQVQGFLVKDHGDGTATLQVGNQTVRGALIPISRKL